jgi:hypothetical protein
MRVYDRFRDEYIDEEDMDQIAPPERYVQITEDMLIENAARWFVKELKKCWGVEEGKQDGER